MHGTSFRGSLIFTLVVVLVAVFSGMAGKAMAQEPSQPHLPVLLLDGAIYPQGYSNDSIPEAYRIDGYPAEVSALYLLQCKGPVRETWLQEIRGLGGELRGYLSYNALLVGMDGTARSRLGELDFLEWSGLYQPYFKVSPALQLRLAQGGGALVLVEIYAARYLQSTLDALSAMPVEVLGAEGDDWCAVIALDMPLDTMEDVAALPAVEWIELCTGGTLPGSLAQAQASREGLEVLAAPPSGGNQRVGLGDTGLGTGGLQGVPSAISGDLQALYSLRGDDGVDVNGHGTAVAGALLGVEVAGGQGAASTPCDLIAYATAYGLGIPPLPISLYSLLQDAYGNGAAIYLSGSVPEGKESLVAYGIYASQRDAFAWNNPAVTLVEPAGNEGTDADGDGLVDRGSLLGGATAKNAVSVGGTEGTAQDGAIPPPLSYLDLEQVFPGRFPSPPLKDDSSAGNSSGMAAFSSRGPTRDGRIKPDLVAPATYILTLTSGGEETCPGIFPSQDPRYARAYGTSMAAAQAAAKLASMRGLLSSKLADEPSAALIKAFAVNGALDLSPGKYGDQSPEIPTAPNVVEGWGEISMDTFAREDSWVKVLDDKEGMRLGESRAFKLEVDAAKQMRVTLAWTDYPSLPESRQNLVNDLDLRLGDPGYIRQARRLYHRDKRLERALLAPALRPGRPGAVSRIRRPGGTSLN
jgi:serine protease AprX